ncbi:hypothetical protein ACFX2C_034889 [Malus domestica]
MPKSVENQDEPNMQSINQDLHSNLFLAAFSSLHQPTSDLFILSMNYWVCTLFSILLVIVFAVMLSCRNE